MQMHKFYSWLSPLQKVLFWFIVLDGFGLLFFALMTFASQGVIASKSIAPLAYQAASVHPLINFPQRAPRASEIAALQQSHSCGGNPTGLIEHPASITPAVIDNALLAAHSPVEGEMFPHGWSAGVFIWTAATRRGIDPAILMGMFFTESHYGTAGEATVTDSVGNQRPLANEPEISGYRYYRSWQESIVATLDLLSEYSSHGATTVSLLAPTWAPSGDGNDPAAYADSIVSVSDQLQQGC